MCCWFIRPGGQLAVEGGMSRYMIESTQKAIEMLPVFNEPITSRSLALVIPKMGMHKASMMLARMVKWGYIERISHGQYRIKKGTK